MRTPSTTSARELDEGLSLQAYNILELGDPSKGYGPGDMRAIPSTLLLRLDGPTRHSLLAYSKAKAAGTAIQTNWSTFYGLVDLAGGGADDTDPAATKARVDKFTKMNLLQFRGQLDEPEFKQLTQLQLDLRQGNAKKANDALKGFRTMDAIIKDRLIPLKISPNAPEDSAEARAVARVRNIVAGEYQDFTERNKREPTGDEAGKIVDAVMGAEVQRGDSHRAFGFLWGVSAKTETLSDAIREGYTIDDVPADDKRLIGEALDKAKLTKSDELITTIYFQTKIRKGGG
jgi:hypothetical protein